MKKIAIVGAGWAGLSAAAELAPYAQVTLFEASRVAGGRARGLVADELSFADNGQHLLIGAYRGVFALMDKVGVDRTRAFVQQPLQWYLADGVRFQAASWLPAPLNLLSAILGARGCRLPEKWALLQQMSALQKWHKAQLPDQSIASWLDMQGVDTFWRLNFWQPMVWGALNTPLEHASLRILCHVLSDGVWNNRAASDYYVPRMDLTALLAQPVLAFLNKHQAIWQPETRVERLNITDNGKVCVNGETFDGVMIAVAPYHVAKLLPENLGDGVRTAIQQLHYHAITTVYLRYAQPLKLPALITGFANGVTQWLIDRSRINGENEIAAVISVSNEVSGSLKTDTQSNQTDKINWAKCVHQDVLRINPDIDEPIVQQVITEKRATIASTLGRTLPEMADLNAANIWLAGDWLYPYYPATLEAAVLSGKATAEMMLRCV